MLEFLRLLEDNEDLTVFAFGTDGIDGPTDAAGAWGNLETVHRASGKGIALEDYLANNDSYGFFQRFGGHLQTGPTGTNVADVYGILRMRCEV